MYNRRAEPRRRVWEYISPNPTTSNWMVGNSQMAKFNGAQDYQIIYKRGGRIEEIISQAEWLITTKGATHVVIDGIQNSITAITRGRLNLEAEILRRLKFLNTRASVVLAEVLYCPQHQHIYQRIQRINRQVKRINREASGLASPKPWRVLGEVRRAQNRKQKDAVSTFPGSFSRDGYHISPSKALEYEAELAAFLRGMVASTPTSGNRT